MNLWNWIQNNRPRLIGFGLMLASSGIDGMYMSRWMPESVWWLGLVLNFVADFATQEMTCYYGQFQRDRSSTKRKMSKVLLAADAIAVIYSWFFSWRQLRMILPAVEPDNWQWVAPIAAGFIPSLLAFIGYAQSLQETNAEPLQVARNVARVATQPETKQDAVFAKETEPPALNDRQIAMLETLASQPHATYTALGETHGVSRTTAKKDTEALITGGMLRRNGHGWEVKHGQ